MGSDPGDRKGVAETGPREGGSPLLFELRGAHPGTPHPLSEDVFRIGSARENDLVVGDRSVSAYQVQIRLAGEDRVVRNLDPRGAVYLNGEAVEEAVLQKGDILTLGETMFRYVLPGESISQQELWSAVGGRERVLETGRTTAWRTPFLFALIAVSLGIVLLVVASRDQGEDSSDGSKMPMQTASTAEVVDPKLLRPLYEKGMDLLSARRWDEAIVTLGELREMAPSFLDTEKAFQEAVRESGSLDLLNQGKGLLVEQEVPEAKRILKGIDRESVYYREMERLVRGIDDSSLDVRIEAAEEALARGDLAAAKKDAESILSRYPNHKVAMGILSEVNRQKGQGKGGEPERSGESGQDRMETAQKGGNSAGESRVGRTGGDAPDTVSDGPPKARSTAAAAEDPLQRSRNAYLKGDMESCLSILEELSRRSSGDGRAGRMLESILASRSAFEQALAFQQEGRLTEALRTWERFLAKDQEIAGGGRGNYFEQASSHLAKLFYERGRKDFERGNTMGAFLFWHMGISVWSEDSELKAGVAQLEDLAKNLYREGYSLQEINLTEAMRRWQEVLKIVSPDNPYFEKARKQIERFSGIP